MSAWARHEAARIEAEGRAMTAAQRDRIAEKFRREIGGVYNLVAVRIEHDHKEAP